MKQSVQNSGVNNQANDNTAYTDGGYTYKNSNSDGTCQSNYYNTAQCHAVFENKNDGKGFHENQPKAPAATTTTSEGINFTSS